MKLSYNELKKAQQRDPLSFPSLKRKQKSPEVYPDDLVFPFIPVHPDVESQEEWLKKHVDEKTKKQWRSQAPHYDDIYRNRGPYYRCNPTSNVSQHQLFPMGLKGNMENTMKTFNELKEYLKYAKFSFNELKSAAEEKTFICESCGSKVPIRYMDKDEDNPMPICKYCVEDTNEVRDSKEMWDEYWAKKKSSKKIAQPEGTEEFNDEEEEENKYYVHSFDVSMGGMEYLWGEWFDNQEAALSKLIEEAKAVTPGTEVSIGMGSVVSEWAPPIEASKKIAMEITEEDVRQLEKLIKKNPPNKGELEKILKRWKESLEKKSSIKEAAKPTKYYNKIDRKKNKIETLEKEIKELEHDRSLPQPEGETTEDITKSIKKKKRKIQQYKDEIKAIEKKIENYWDNKYDDIEVEKKSSYNQMKKIADFMEGEITLYTHNVNREYLKQFMNKLDMYDVDYSFDGTHNVLQINDYTVLSAEGQQWLWNSIEEGNFKASSKKTAQEEVDYVNELEGQEIRLHNTSPHNFKEFQGKEPELGVVMVKDGNLIFDGNNYGKISLELGQSLFNDAFYQEFGYQPGSPEFKKELEEEFGPLGSKKIAKTKSNSTFEEWMKDVDKALINKLGMPSSDLPDWLYRDAYDAGRQSSAVANQVARELKSEWGSKKTTGRKKKKRSIKQNKYLLSWMQYDKFGELEPREKEVQADSEHDAFLQLLQTEPHVNKNDVKIKKIGAGTTQTFTEFLLDCAEDIEYQGGFVYDKKDVEALPERESIPYREASKIANEQGDDAAIEYLEKTIGKKEADALCEVYQDLSGVKLCSIMEQRIAAGERIVKKVSDESPSLED